VGRGNEQAEREGAKGAETLAKITASAVRRPEERVIPFNRGIEFFPDAESSWHRVRTAPPVPVVPPIPLPPPPPLPPFLSSVPARSLFRSSTYTRVLALALSLSLSLSLSPSPSSPPPPPGIPGTALSRPWRRVARGNCASRRRRADVTPGMELTRAAPLYAVVEGNKKCKSKRVGVGEWEKKNKRRAR